MTRNPCRIFAELPTPFEEDGSVDWFAFGRILENCLSGPCKGVLLFGGASEAQTLYRKEKRGLLQDAALACSSRHTLVAALRATAGEMALADAVDAKTCGADALLLYGDGCRMPELFRMVRALQKRCDLPLWICDESLKRCAAGFAVLAREAGIAGVAEQGLTNAESALLQDLLLDFSPVPERFLFEEAAPAREFDGTFSKAACCLPELVVNTKRNEAQEKRFRALLRLFSGPEGIAAFKWALYRRGLCLPTVRLPLAEASPGVARAVDALLKTQEPGGSVRTLSAAKAQLRFPAPGGENRNV